VETLAGNQAPFLTDRIDAPMGFNLAWATTIPGPALLLAPLTELAGPLASYNLLAIAAPALAAWSAYLLCRHLTRDLVAALIGGWAFGFSSYLLGQTLNHVNLALVWALPLIVLVVIRLIEGSLRPRRGLLALAALIAMQFLTFTEVAATATLVGGLTLAAALALGPADLRTRIVRALPWIAGGYALALVLVSPLRDAAQVRAVAGRSRDALGEAGWSRVLELTTAQGTLRDARSLPLLFRRLGPMWWHAQPSDAVVDAMARRVVYRADSDANFLQDVLRWDARLVAGDVREPVLVVAGASDLTFLPSESRELAEALPHGSFLSIDGAGHLPFVERGDAFAVAVERFFAP
jgi:pimeloyl-ACP methyl ester carboxylesterase